MRRPRLLSVLDSVTLALTLNAQMFKEISFHASQGSNNDGDNILFLP